MKIENHSHLHIGHVGVKKRILPNQDCKEEDYPTHITIHIVAKELEDKNKIEQQRMIMKILQLELSSYLHSVLINVK